MSDPGTFPVALWRELNQQAQRRTVMSSADLYDLNEYATGSYQRGDEFTPTTEAIRATYATDYYMVTVGDRDTPEGRAAAFDRWLAAHDAEVRRQGPITDAQVEAAAKKLYGGTDIGWHALAGGWQNKHRSDARAALEAARDAS